MTARHNHGKVHHVYIWQLERIEKIGLKPALGGMGGLVRLMALLSDGPLNLRLSQNSQKVGMTGGRGQGQHPTIGALSQALLLPPPSLALSYFPYLVWWTGILWQ